MRVDVFEFDLPPERIALAPVEPRDSARLLVVRPDRAFDDRVVAQLPELLRPGDALVMNDTRVIPAALDGLRIRGPATAKIAVTLLRRVGDRQWRAFARPAKRLVAGDTVQFGDLTASVTAKLDGGEIELAFNLGGAEFDRALAEVGQMPLPPYIALKRPPRDGDATSYQTVYARTPGAVAAPTAGLHMTDRLLAALLARGVSLYFVTLHVGAGTFLPVKVNDTRDHVMHTEWCSISSETAAGLADVRSRGGRVIALGTTALRVLESAVSPNGRIAAFSGETSIFITPGYRFRAVDMLMTNFHLPRSTLFMLVSAFTGLETMQAAYAHAVANAYRFYSYGDACLLHRIDGQAEPKAVKA